MIPEPATGLARFVASAAVSVAEVQSRLSARNDARVAAWQQLLVASRDTPLEGVARAIAPSLLVVESCVIDAQVSVEHSVTNELSIRLLNAGVVSRYGSADLFRSRLQVEVRRVPLPPDNPLNYSSPL